LVGVFQYNSARLVKISIVGMCVIKTNLMHYICSVYFVCWPGSISNRAKVNWKAQHIPIVVHTSIPPDDGLQICLKHVEVDCRNKLRINGAASSWFVLHRCIKMHSKKKTLYIYI